MIYDVRLSPRAWRDLARVADFLVSQGSTTSRARSAIEAALRSLDRFPERGAPTSIPSVRELHVRIGKQGYVIRYVIEEGLVVVLRIFHTLEDR